MQKIVDKVGKVFVESIEVGSKVDIQPKKEAPKTLPKYSCAYNYEIMVHLNGIQEVASSILVSSTTPKSSARLRFTFSRGAEYLACRISLTS